MDGDFSGFAESSHSGGLLKHKDAPADSDWGGAETRHWSVTATGRKNAPEEPEYRELDSSNGPPIPRFDGTIAPEANSQDRGAPIQESNHVDRILHAHEGSRGSSPRYLSRVPDILPRSHEDYRAARACSIVARSRTPVAQLLSISEPSHRTPVHALQFPAQVQSDRLRAFRVLGRYRGAPRQGLDGSRGGRDPGTQSPLRGRVWRNRGHKIPLGRGRPYGTAAKGYTKIRNTVTQARQ